MILLFGLDFLLVAIAYIIGFILVVALAQLVAPRIAQRVGSRFTLETSMLITGGIAVITGLLGIVLLTYLLVDTLGIEASMTLMAFVVLIALFGNILSYLVSPLMINVMYGAKPDKQLQEIVDSVATRLGFSRSPKAVIVNGPPNAFAYGNIVFGRYIAVTRSMMELMSREELEAVIGHELGHHRHKDNAIMLFMGMIPSVLYYLGVTLVRVGMFSGLMGAMTSEGREKRGGNGGILLVLVGVVAVILSFIVQVLVLAFSRLREYYADAAGAFAAGIRPMQRALARLHLYYSGSRRGRAFLQSSKLKTLFIYAFTQAYANPFYPVVPGRKDDHDIDDVIEKLKKEEVSTLTEIFSTHPPIPKRIRFLETLRLSPIKY